jgi:hypothetical protein
VRIVFYEDLLGKGPLEVLRLITRPSPTGDSGKSPGRASPSDKLRLFANAAEIAAYYRRSRLHRNYPL